MTTKSLIESYVAENEQEEYEKLKKVAPKEMDDRCFLGLHSMPEDICYAAVRRLHAIKTAGRELTEEEISVLPGCPWAIQHQKSNYCFFKYAKDYMSENSPSDQEIAHIIRCSIEDVKKSNKSAISKIKASQMISQFRESFDDCEVVEGRDSDDFYSIIK